MAHRVVCITRVTAAGGEAIGHAVAERLGFRYVDDEVITLAAQPGTGYDYDPLADDLATLLGRLDLRRVTLVGFSMGGGEVARYLSRHGAGRVARVALVATVVPGVLRTADNPEVVGCRR